ncbi:uncharacterized protein LOC106011380 [Aplysia californica]|uniref:Uncharacterized protein LOC106011380 n=1 Tax=Aplysia californica TaxID=6500 RepID=A0ABM1VR07_APLCA|nr:uncharacterized protein LOC106011380 [Aplysia californica]
MGSQFRELRRCLCFVVIITGISADEQFQYVLAFPKHVIQAVSSLAVSPLSWDFVKNVEVTVTAPARRTSSGKIQTQEYSHNFKYPSTEQWMLYLEQLVQFTKSGIGKNYGVQVTSTAQLVVQARSIKRSSIGLHFGSAGAFNVMPFKLLSNEYLVVTNCQFRHCFLLVVNPDGINDVTIELKLNPIQTDIIYKNEINTFHSGQSLQESLGPLDVLQIVANRTDLTGTWIKANRFIAVFAGADFDFISLETHSYSIKDMAVEQLPPVTVLGQHYILTPFFSGTKDSFIKIGYLNPSTTFSGLEHVETNVDTVKSTSTSLMFKLGDMIIYLQASAPVLVLQYVRSQEVGYFYDLSQAVVYPISKWGIRAEFLTFVDNSALIVITSQCKCITEIEVRGAIEELYTPGEAENLFGTDRFCSREINVTQNDSVNKIQVNGGTCYFSGFILAKEGTLSGWLIPLSTFKSTDNKTTLCRPKLLNRETTTPDINNTCIVEGTSHRPTPQFRSKMCPCPCLHASKTYRALLNATVMSKMAAIQSYLHVPRENLSRRVRSKMSAKDHRLSSTSIGSIVFAVTFLPIFGSLVMSDCYRSWLYLCRRWYE